MHDAPWPPHAAEHQPEITVSGQPGYAAQPGANFGYGDLVPIRLIFPSARDLNSFSNSAGTGKSGSSVMSK
jgi:hypothetical protein